MSFFIKTVIGFSGLGSAAFIPFAITGTSEKVEFRLPPPVMDSQVLEKLIEEGSCTISKGHRGRTTLYLCLFLNEKGSLTPSFHLLWRSSWKEPMKIQKVTKISYTEMQLEDGTKWTYPGRYLPPFWMRRGWDISPEKDCQRKEGSVNSIVCKNSSTSQAEINVF